MTQYVPNGFSPRTEFTCMFSCVTWYKNVAGGMMLVTIRKLRENKLAYLK